MYVFIARLRFTYHALLCFAAADQTIITTAIHIFHARFHCSKCINRGSLMLSKPMCLQIEIVNEQHQNSDIEPAMVLSIPELVVSL